MKVCLILFNFKNIDSFNLDDYFKIGVDKGALNAIHLGYKLDIAIGDFDSVNNLEFELIKKNSKKIISLNSIKDDTDTLSALKEAYKISEDVTIFGGISGKRIEHFLSNITLFNQYPNLKIIDDNSYIYLLDRDYELTDEINKYKFISFFALNNHIKLSLLNFKYELKDYDFSLFDSLCVSNEAFVGANIKIQNGRILVICSKDDKTIE